MNIDYDIAYDLIKDRLINDDNLEVRKNALIALYNLSDRRILEIAFGEILFFTFL